MRGMQRGWFGKERYFLVVPVDEDMARGREDVGGTTAQERNGFILVLWERMGEDRVRGGVLYSAQA